MEYNGFKTIKDSRGIAVEFAMPPVLREYFFAKLYCRGEVCDSTEGSPSAIWETISGDYGGAELIAPVQVHGTHILEASKSAPLPEREEADGIYIDCETEKLGSLRFADCTPVVIAGTAETPWMAMLHSGFQGTLKNICKNAAEMVFARYPEQKPENMWAWIGPAIGPECYSRKKSDPTTMLALESFSPENITGGGKESETYNFDIKGQIASQLCEIGLSHDKIFKYDCCTFCRQDLFYSYRGGDLKNRLFLLGGRPKS